MSVDVFPVSDLFDIGSQVPVYLIWVEAISMFKYEFTALMVNEWRPQILGRVAPAPISF